MTDNSYMFVDEDKEDISEAGGREPKGQYFDKSVTGKIEDKSTINLVADEDISSELSVHSKLSENASDIRENLRNNIRDSISDSADTKSSVALGSDRITSLGKGFGIASLLCGLISLAFFCSVFNFFTSILSIIFGVVQIRKGGGKGLAITGIVCSILSVILLIICMRLIMNNTAFVNMITENMLDMNLFKMM